ncbi:MAG: WcaI family glycosyltransferase [Porticoccaceae bacterium]
MKVLLYGINYSPELTGIGKYSGEMARWLAEHGHDVRVVTAPPYYPDWKVWQGYPYWCFSKRQEEGVTVIRCPLYVPSKPTALKRLVHLASFSLSSSLAILAQLRWKPDLLVVVVPTLFCAPQALLLAKLSGAKSVLHIQDYEVDALFGLGIAQGNVLKRFAFGIEGVVLRAFDRVTTISSGMLLRAHEEGVAAASLRFFPNWSGNLSIPKNVSRNAALLTRLGVDPGKRILLYSGDIGESRGWRLWSRSCRAAVKAQDLVFLIVGEGAGKARLVDLAQQKA